MINRSEIAKLAHELAREEMAFCRKMTYRKAIAIGMAIAWRRAKDKAFTATTGLVHGFQVVEPRTLWP